MLDDVFVSAYQEVVKMLSLQPGQHVLDVGCGLGGAAFLMSQVRQTDLYHIGHKVYHNGQSKARVHVPISDQ